MTGRTRPSPARPSRAGVSVESRLHGTDRCYARCADWHGRRRVVKPAGGNSIWPDWRERFTADYADQPGSQRLSCRSPDGERLLFRDLVRHHYLPSLRDASPDTRTHAASHLGNGSGVPTRDSAYGARAARSRLLFTFGLRRAAETVLRDG